MTFDVIGPEAEAHLNWITLTEALEAGHRLPRAEISDMFLYRGADTLLTRAAWIDGLGQLVKCATVFPGNKELAKPTVNGAVTLFSDRAGELEAVIDFHLVTKWKTAGDSLLAARKLARPDSRNILLVGAGTVARSMISAYGAIFPDARFTVWSRTSDSAQALVRQVTERTVAVADDLEGAVAQADVICTCTMSTSPLIRGEWLVPGQHLDLIGAYRPDMREVDNAAIARARLFVDSRATTVHHIGEVKDPIAQGVLTEAGIQGDFYDLAAGAFQRGSDQEITICKNGGGAHLDLMTSAYVLAAWKAR